jgi:hypothetical protein
MRRPRSVPALRSGLCANKAKASVRALSLLPAASSSAKTRETSVLIRTASRKVARWPFNP